MIITCNCGQKKFTLPDNSIPEAEEWFNVVLWIKMEAISNKRTNWSKILKFIKSKVRLKKLQKFQKERTEKLKKGLGQIYTLQNIYLRNMVSNLLIHPNLQINLIKQIKK